MMELKDFQQTVLDGLDQYLDELVLQRENYVKIERLKQENPGVEIDLPDFTESAWVKLRNTGLLPSARANIAFSPRKDGVNRPVPAISLKIPTGGGKTLLAANAVSRIMGKWVRRNSGFVLWIVPNESIYAQTKKALINREHPYRQQLDKAAAGRVKILEKNDALNKRDVESHLCVMLLMLQSANRETQETLRMFRDRGNVHGFFPAEDDYMAHHEVLKVTPNLDVYGERDIMAAIVKDSLGNVLRSIRPLVVMDEGHRGYSKLALQTLYGFNPCFVLELSATPKDRPKDTPPMFSNWLVDVRGKELDKEEMIKLPINVTVRGGDDWRDCLRESYECLNGLQKESEKLKANADRYIRPICLVQVERTGKDQRESGFIHAEAVREYLLTLGVHEMEIAVKTSEKNELKDPENIDLLNPACQVRFIITKQALQEGWDCPFAYVLCSLAPTTNKNAMTQLVGKILRQPDTIKTGMALLDECYVICFHATTKEIIENIKDGLEQEGMADLSDAIRDQSGGDGTKRPEPRKLLRRDAYKGTKIFLPVINWVDGSVVRPLEYEQDVLFRLDWERIRPDARLVERIKNTKTTADTRMVRIGLKDDPTEKDFLETADVMIRPFSETFDPVYAVRAVSDIIPNPWIARDVIAQVIKLLATEGLDIDALGSREAHIIAELRTFLSDERDKLAEGLFKSEVEAGRIQFRLRTDGNNWKLPDFIETDRVAESRKLYRDDGAIVEKSLFSPVYADDLNEYEQRVACYLDGGQAVNWWHRNIAKRHYSLQGWRKHKVYPDFIFAMTADGEKQRLLIIEMKGNFLDNPDSKYKQKLLNLCSDIFTWENITALGELELVYDPATTVTCALVYQDHWKTDLAGIMRV
jgi:type III restriction enzyme